MATAPAPSSGIVPAQLGFLAIYNPSLGTTDDTIDDQIVYYASVTTQSGPKRRRLRPKPGVRPTDALSKEERNERLRQIGLAQGMVEFGRSFSSGKPVDSIDTERSRVLVHELEPGWWILASIDLTRLPLPAKHPATASPAEQPPDQPAVEYSSREVKPTSLLLADLLRAHATFLLHHASSLSALFVRTQRDKFVGILSRYWDLFLSSWNVLLHGNPACAVYGGVKIAACGELGVGVGEEDRGSGERDVLEGLISGMEGLSDVVVGRYGANEKREGKWLGTGEDPGAEDGVVFSGVGALSRRSLRTVSWWMEDCYTWGENAYGVRDRPGEIRDKKRRRVDRGRKGKAAEVAGKGKEGGEVLNPPAGGEVEGASGMDKMLSYLKLGYGTSWSLGGSSGTPSLEGIDDDEESTSNSKPSSDDTTGRFLIGLTSDLESLRSSEDDPFTRDQTDSDITNSRTVVRTLSVQLEQEGENLPESLVTKDLESYYNNKLAEERPGSDGTRTDDRSTIFDSQDRNKTKKLRVVMYAANPFIFVFLFQPRTESLAFESLYRSLHARLAPIYKSLLVSTAYRPKRPDLGPSEIYDLIWDPRELALHSTMPNIPEPVTVVGLGSKAAVWTRAEALNTHNQILNMFTATRGTQSESERTCKTSRGWWVVWNRIVGRVRSEGSESGSRSDEDEDEESEDDGGTEDEEEVDERRVVVNKEIFLIRKASDHGGGTRSLSLAGVSSGGGWADGASRLAQGIGVDTRRYVEGLLRVNR